MTQIAATRVSIYDFLYVNTRPLLPLLADVAGLSLTQSRHGITYSLQAIVSALLSYEQHQGGAALLKKLLNRNSVKELRQYNAMNFVTLRIADKQGNGPCELLFHDSKRMRQVSERIAEKIDSSLAQSQHLLCLLTTIVLREIAILADFAQLNGQEISDWLRLQPQFLSHARFAADHSQSNTNALPTPPEFDSNWHQIVGFTPPTAHSGQTNNQQIAHNDKQPMPHYAKAIGRTSSQGQQTTDTLVFAAMTGIQLPYQRWLIQLAKISDIYLSRQRLRIASEPETAPSRPLVNLGMLGNSDAIPETASERPIEYDAPAPFWKNPVILLLVLIIGILSSLAILKYQGKQAERVANQQALEQAMATQADELPQDIAIVRVDDDSEMDGENAINEENTVQEDSRNDAATPAE